MGIIKRLFSKPWRWVAMGAISAFLTVQSFPYLALASQPAEYRTATPTSANLLAQLESLPSHTVALPNFDPGVNGFQFSNQELIQAIDIERNAAAWEEVLTEQLQKLFGNQVCIGEEVRTCVLTSAAQDWLKTQLERMDLGIAEGMATAALALWDPEHQPSLPWWQRLINFLLQHTVFRLARTLFDLQTFIANLFLLQNVNEVALPTQAIRDSRTPTQILLSILDVFLSNSLDPFTMGIYRIVEGVLTEGHSLTPYQVEERGDGKYWVYVYDSNYPAGRSTSPTDLHLEFDTTADTWTYQPMAEVPPFNGDAQSKNLDLTRLSWRQLETETEAPAEKGPFTCPFCNPEPAQTIPETPAATVTLVGEGVLTVQPYGTETAPSMVGLEKTALVPFRGGLSRAVPASYKLPQESLDQPLKITLEGTPASPLAPSTLQIAGPGYTADFEGLAIPPGDQLTMYVVPHTTGPELTFESPQASTIPRLSIHLTDDTNTFQFDSSTPATGYSLTERRVSKSSGFELAGLKLPAGKRVALTTINQPPTETSTIPIKRLYFADDDLRDSQYALTVKNRIVIKDRIQVGEQKPDFLNYTLTYEEEMRANNVQVDGQTQAYFDYEPAFIDPAERPREELIAAFEQRDFPITIAYEPLDLSAAEGPITFTASDVSPISKRVFQGSLRKGYK
jgi:hypothetical protein